MMTLSKIVAVALCATGISASAQVSFSGKANLLFPTASSFWKSLKTTATQAYDESGKNNTGFNVGLSARLNLPFSLFLMPEVYYTTFKTEYTDMITNTTLQAKSNRVDVPVLVGYNLWGENLGAFIGPVASFNLAKEDTYNDFQENAKTNFTVGFQFGLQAKISKLILNARYEGALSKDSRTFIDNNVLGERYVVDYDNRPSLLILGVGYQF